MARAYIAEWLLDRVAQKPESVVDPIDRAAVEAALRTIDAMSLWYGELALYVCNFELGASTVVHLVPTVEEIGPREPDRLPAARAAATELARSRHRVTGDDIDVAERLLALASIGAKSPLELEALSVDAAFEVLREHLSTSQMRAPFAEARALLDAFPDHRIFRPVGAGRGQIASTVLYVRAVDGRRAALVDYTGDGP